jgi:hypothetical protein
MTDLQILKLAFRWIEDSGAEGREDLEVEALHPREHYGELNGEGEISAFCRHARIYAHTARSTIVFMDVTGLERSPSFSIVFEDRGDRFPAAFDHPRLWRLPASERSGNGAAAIQYLVTAEPYRDGYKAVEAWCASHGWQHYTMPSSIGLWFPAGDQGTRLVLASPPEIGLPLPPLADVLLQRMPRWVEGPQAGG